LDAEAGETAAPIAYNYIFCGYLLGRSGRRFVTRKIGEYRKSKNISDA
jgi:hypothetical protein